MNWSSFIEYFEKNANSPVITSLLKKTHLLEEKEGALFVGCPNYGVKVFFEGKHQVILPVLSAYVGAKISVVYSVEEKKQRKKTDTLSIEEFQSNREGLLRSSGVDDRFTFKNFAVSSSNHIAHAAAMAVSEQPGKLYNPFLVYGGVGVGKTHLAHAIVNKVIEMTKNPHVLVCTSEEFTNDLIELIRSKNTQKLRKKYRNLDVLVVDDIQFIAGKNYVQEEFYHTFNNIVQGGGQIILTSDRPPTDIEKLEKRLRSRFSGGLMIDMQNPDFELRCAILLIKARERNIPLEFDVAQLIANQTADTRELEGKLLRLYALAAQNGGTISEDLIEKEQSPRQKRGNPHSSPSDALRIICAYFNVSQVQLKGASRKEQIVKARQIAMYILRVQFGLKLEEIAFLLRRKDHTTIIHGVEKITGLVMKDPAVKNEVWEVLGEIN